jgi:uroporphyrinogen-III decarboxylase
VIEKYAELPEQFKSHTYEVTSSLPEGPTDVATEIRGITDFFMDLYRDPEAVHTIMDIMTETCIAFARAQYEADGSGMLHIMISDDSSSQLSQAHWEKFGLPYL